MPLKTNKYEAYNTNDSQQPALLGTLDFVAEEKIKEMLDAMQDDDITELVKIFFSQIHPLIIQHQSTLEGLLDFEATLKFCLTYDIFQSLVSKIQVKELFTVFASF